MKKLMTSLTIAMLTVTALFSTASAQDTYANRVPYERYDYSRGLQFVGASAAGVAGTLGGGYAGWELGSSLCSGGFECLFTGALGAGVGGLTVGIGGASLATVLLGGDNATGQVYVSTMGGALAGGLMGSLGSLVLVSALSSGGASGEARLVSSVAIIGVSSGVGAALGYQDRYRSARIQNVSLAPMLTSEHQGLVLSGTF